jgi:hypothetical protein
MPFVPLRFAPTENFAAKQTQQLGQSMLNLGGELGRIAFDIQNEANKVRVDDAMNQLVKFRTDAQVEAFSLTGRNALERPDGKALPDEYDEKLQKHLDAIEATLGNDAQRAALRAQAAPIRAQLYGNLSSHMVEQQKEMRRETWAATIDTATNQANLLWGDEKIRKQSAEAIRTTIDEMAKDQGWDDKIKESKLAQALSPMHAGIIQGMADADRIDLAKAYYDENAPTMSMAVRAKAMNLIEVGDFEKKTQDGAAAVWAMADGNAAEALKLAREKFSGKEEDAVITRIKTLDAEETTIRERDQRDAGDSAWGLYAEGKKIPASVWARMDGRDKIAIRNAQRAEANHLAAANKEAQRDARDEAYFTLYENDDALINARPAEISSLLKQGFTQTQVSSLLRKKEKLANEAESVSVSKHALNNAFLRNGIENKSKKDKALRGMIESRIDEEIYAEQQQRGRALTREEKDKIINRQFVEVGSYYKQTGLFSTSTGTQKKKYYEVENKDSIVIPQADRDRITKTFRDSGVMVTPDRLRTYYLRELGK